MIDHPVKLVYINYLRFLFACIAQEIKNGIRNNFYVPMARARHATTTSNEAAIELALFGRGPGRVVLPVGGRL